MLQLHFVDAQLGRGVRREKSREWAGLSAFLGAGVLNPCSGGGWVAGDLGDLNALVDGAGDDDRFMRRIELFREGGHALL